MKTAERVQLNGKAEALIGKEMSHFGLWDLLKMV